MTGSRSKLVSAVVIWAALVASPSASAAGRCGDPAARPWCDTTLSPDSRADLLLAQLTADEKIELLGGDNLTGVLGAEGTHTGTNEGVPRLGLPTIYFSDGPAGPRSGAATAMPSPLALGATFDRKLAARHAEVIADEVIHKGNDVVFAPTVDLIRTPLAGRSFEAIGGEDPYLSAELAVPWIETAQAAGLIANVKHFAGNNQEGTGPLADQARPGSTLQALGILSTIGNRMSINARIDERTMREMYLPMFEAAVKRANVASVMCAYNKVNGPFACQSRPLLEDTLRGDWGFEGFTIADYNGAHDTAGSLRDGLDFEPWPGLFYNPPLVQATLAAGGATMADVDAHVHRYLRTLFAYGALDREAYATDEAAIDRAAHAKQARRIAESAITLLRNDGILPLRRNGLDSIAVIGAGATRYVTGGGSSEIKPYSYTTPLQAITAEAGPGVAVTSDDGSDPGRAASAAAAADVAIVVAPSFSTEGIDRRCLSLECPPAFGDEDALIEVVAAANPDTVVVVESGGPVLTPWDRRVGAVLEAWYPGAEGGSAIARVLFGKVDAQGRLPVTFPASEADLPTAGDSNAYPGVGDVVTYDEGMLIGYRHYDANGIAPAYPFGHGLSYTSFRFADLRVRRARGAGKLAKVSVAVTNTGARRGVAVPQLYLGLPSSVGAPQPPKALKGFARVALRPRQRRRVRFTITKRDVSYWDVGTHSWQRVDGCVRVRVGRSSRALPLGAKLGLGTCAGASLRLLTDR